MWLWFRNCHYTPTESWPLRNLSKTISMKKISCLDQRGLFIFRLCIFTSVSLPTRMLCSVCSSGSEPHCFWSTQTRIFFFFRTFTLTSALLEIFLFQIFTSVFQYHFFRNTFPSHFLYKQSHSDITVLLNYFQNICYTWHYML